MLAPAARARGLEARTAPPLPPANFVPRARLRDQIESAVPLGVALIVAPGGFGKTVALSDFARNAPFPVAWLSVSSADADLVAFVEALSTALRAVLPGFGQEAALLARAGGASAAASLADELAGELSEHGQPIGLVLDDFHYLDGAGDVTRLVGALLERMPASAFVAVASRTLPALPHARLLAAGRMRGVAADDLRFTREEIATYLGDRPGVDAEHVYETSGGWAASLTLGDDAGNAFSVLADYLETEVWGQQSPEMRDFLLRASVPPTLTEDVCARVLGEPRGATYLTQAHRAGLFVAALPDGGWRLHDLFRDFLRTQLRRSDPFLWSELHRAVAADMRDDRRPADAITLLVEASLFEDAADMLLAHADELTSSGRWGAIRRWSERLPVRVVSTRPRLLTLQGRALRPVADAATVLRRFDAAVEGCLAEADEIGAAEALGHRAARLGLSGRHAESNDDCRRASDLLDGRDHPILATILRVLGTNSAVTGQYDLAFIPLKQALGYAQRHRQVTEVAACERALGFAYARSGSLGPATSHYERAVRVAQEVGDLSLVADININLGHVYGEQGAVDLARSVFEEAAALGRRVGQQRALGYALDNLGILEREAGRVDAALALLKEALDVARVSDESELLCQCLDQLAQTHLLAAPSSASAEALARQALAEAERAELRPLIARAQVTLAAVFLARRLDDPAWSNARAALDLLGPRGSRSVLLRAQLIAALAGQAIGREDWIADLVAAAAAVPLLANRRFLRAELAILGGRLRALAELSPVAASAVEAILAAAPDSVPDPVPETVARPTRQLPRITAHLLGHPEVLIEGSAPRGDKYAWGRQATRELFYLLEAQRQGLTGEAIVDRLWPETAPGSGQAQLWTTVHRLRSALSASDRELGKRLVMAERGVYRLNPELAVSTDVAAFEAATQRALALPTDAPEALEALQAADVSYRGEYLAGVDALWVKPRRRDLERLHAAVMRRLVELTLGRGRPAEAAAVAERLVKVEPFSERACELLLRAYLATGDRERARAAYRRFARRLERHLDATPPAALGELVGL
jgi:LuxR family maltose regulon positive regulatory protein